VNPVDNVSTDVPPSPGIDHATCLQHVGKEIIVSVYQSAHDDSRPPQPIHAIWLRLQDSA
jgi:hypothetical protein